MKVARDFGWEVEGNDISASAVEFGMKWFGLHIMLGYLEDLNLKANHHGAVNLWNTLEHTCDPILTLKKCREICFYGKTLGGQ